MHVLFDNIEIKGESILTGGELLIKPNGVNVIKGKNGSGKTLLFSKLHGIYFDKMVMVSQKNNKVIANITVEENIWLQTARTFENRERYRKIVEQLQIENILYLNPKYLSGGEKRIISIARGLLTEKSIILIDEPSNDLDYVKVENLINCLSYFKKEKTFIVITHDDRFDQVADEIFHIENKKVGNNITKKKIKEIKKKKKIRKFMEQQIKGIDVIKKIIFLFFPFVGFLKRRNKFFEKVFGRDFFFLLITICFCVFTYFLLEDAAENQLDLIPPIHENQIDILSPLTSSLELLEQSLPLSLIDFIMDEETTLTRSDLEEAIEELLERPITFTQNFESNDTFRAIPWEYWDSENRHYIFMLDLYSERYLNSQSGTVPITTKNYFSLPTTGTGEGAVSINLSYVYSINHSLSREFEENRDIYPIHTILLLNDEVNFFDFINRELSEDLLEGNYWIRSNATIELLNQAFALYFFENFQLSMVLVVFALMVISTLFLIFKLMSSANKIVILKNNGIESKETLREMNIINNNFFQQIFCIILVFVFNLLIVNRLGLNEFWIFYFPIAIFTIFVLFLSPINYLIIRFFINRYYHWKARL